MTERSDLASIDLQKELTRYMVENRISRRLAKTDRAKRNSCNLP